MGTIEPFCACSAALDVAGGSLILRGCTLSAHALGAVAVSRGGHALIEALSPPLPSSSSSMCAACAEHRRVRCARAQQVPLPRLALRVASGSSSRCRRGRPPQRHEPIQPIGGVAPLCRALTLSRHGPVQNSTLRANMAVHGAAV